jgi:hypothetical protein
MFWYYNMLKSRILLVAGAPKGENREPGENPGRSRHCDSRALRLKMATGIAGKAWAIAMTQSQETCL